MTEAEHHLECIRKAIARDREFSTTLRLSPTERRVLALMYKRELVTDGSLLQLMDHGFENTSDVHKVFIHKLRRKLKPIGVKIKNIYGVGYQLQNKEKLKEHIVRI